MRLQGIGAQIIDVVVLVLDATKGIQAQTAEVVIE
jgi:translation initiation factor IF-2